MEQYRWKHQMREALAWPKHTHLRYNIAKRMRPSTSNNYLLVIDEEEDVLPSAAAAADSKQRVDNEPPVTGCQETVTGCRPTSVRHPSPVTAPGIGHPSPVTGDRAPGIGRPSPVTGRRAPVIGRPVTPPPPPPASPVELCRDGDDYEGMGMGVNYMHSSPVAFGSSPYRKRMFPIKLTTDREEEFLIKQQKEKYPVKNPLIDLYAELERFRISYLGLKTPELPSVDPRTPKRTRKQQQQQHDADKVLQNVTSRSDGVWKVIYRVSNNSQPCTVDGSAV